MAATLRAHFLESARRRLGRACRRERDAPSGLRDGDALALVCPAGLEEELRELGALARAGRGLEDDDGVLLEEVEEGVACGREWGGGRGSAR